MDNVARQVDEGPTSIELSGETNICKLSNSLINVVSIPKSLSVCLPLERTSSSLNRESQCLSIDSKCLELERPGKKVEVEHFLYPMASGAGNRHAYTSWPMVLAPGDFSHK